MHGGILSTSSISMNPSPPVPSRDGALFATTRWTIVSMAGVPGEGRERMAALEQLCETYRPAVLAFLKGSGKSREDAEDLTQQFFYQMLTKKMLSHAEAKRGKFRSFLLACVNNFSRDQFHRQQAQKRGGGMKFEMIDGQEPPCQKALPDQDFDRKWAETVIESSLKRVEAEWLEQGKPFEELKGYLVETKGEIPFETKAAELEISMPALKSAVYRLRQRYGACVREIVAETIAEGDSVDDELNCLLEILAG